MNQEIRKTVKKQLIDAGLTQRELAAKTGMSYQYLTAMLTGRKGEAPRRWREVLDALGLELTVKPKSHQGEPLDVETKSWLESDLSRLGEYEPYDWGDVGPDTIGEPLHFDLEANEWVSDS